MCQIRHSWVGHLLGRKHAISRRRQNLLLVAGSAALRQAKLTGPSVYARLALLPKQASHLRLQTEPAEPSFCPEFLAVQEAHLKLDTALLRALATQVNDSQILQVLPEHSNYIFCCVPAFMILKEHTFNFLALPRHCICAARMQVQNILSRLE